MGVRCNAWYKGTPSPSPSLSLSLSLPLSPPTIHQPTHQPTHHPVAEAKGHKYLRPRQARQLAQDEDELETLLGKLERLQSKAVESEDMLRELEQDTTAAEVQAREFSQRLQHRQTLLEGIKQAERASGRPRTPTAPNEGEGATSAKSTRGGAAPTIPLGRKPYRSSTRTRTRTATGEDDDGSVKSGNSYTSSRNTQGSGSVGGDGGGGGGQGTLLTALRCNCYAPLSVYQRWYPVLIRSTHSDSFVCPVACAPLFRSPLASASTTYCHGAHCMHSYTCPP